MNSKRTIALLIAVLFISVSIWTPISAAKDLEPLPEEQNDEDAPYQDPATSEAEVKMFFRGKTITPTRPLGNSSGESTNCPGRPYGGRIMGTVIGQWSVTITQDATISGSVSIALWAKSTGGAKNAGFRINMYRSGGNTQSYFTNRQDLSQTPAKFTAEGTYNQGFTVGDTYDVQLVWLSDPRMIVGPSGAGEFLYGNAIYDSMVKVVFSPHPLKVLNITVPEVEINKETMKITADFQDYLGAEPSAMIFGLAVSGQTSASPSNLEAPQASKGGGNVSSVSWKWNHKADNAKNGDYTFTVSISYDGNSSMMNTTNLKIKFPGKKAGDSGILGLGGDVGGILVPLIVAVVVILVVLGVVYSVVKKRRMKRMLEEEEED